MRFLKKEKLSKSEIKEIIKNGLDQDEFDNLTLDELNAECNIVLKERDGGYATWLWDVIPLKTKSKLNDMKHTQLVLIRAKEFIYNGRKYMLEVATLTRHTPRVNVDLLRFYNDKGQVWNIINDYKEITEVSKAVNNYYSGSKDFSFVFYKYFKHDEKVTLDATMYNVADDRIKGAYAPCPGRFKIDSLNDKIDTTFAITDFLNMNIDSAPTNLIKDDDIRVGSLPLRSYLYRIQLTGTVSKSEKILNQAIEEYPEVKQYILENRVVETNSNKEYLEIKSFGHNLILGTLYSVFDTEPISTGVSRSYILFYNNEKVSFSRIKDDVFTSKNVYGKNINTIKYYDEYKIETKKILSNHMSDKDVVVFSKVINTFNDLFGIIESEVVAKMISSPIGKTIKSFYMSKAFASKSQAPKLIDAYLGERLNDKPFPEGYGFTNEQLQVIDKAVMSEVVSYPRVLKSLKGNPHTIKSTYMSLIGTVSKLDEDDELIDFTKISLEDFNVIINVYNDFLLMDIGRRRHFNSFPYLVSTLSYSIVTNNAVDFAQSHGLDVQKTQQRFDEINKILESY